MFNRPISKASPCSRNRSATRNTLAEIRSKSLQNRANITSPQARGSKSRAAGAIISNNYLGLAITLIAAAKEEDRKGFGMASAALFLALDITRLKALSEFLGTEDTIL